MKTYLITGPEGVVLVDDVVEVQPTELLEFFFVKIGGLMILSLDDDDLLLGSIFSISCTFLLT